MAFERRLSVRARVESEGASAPRLDVALEIGGGVTAIMGDSGSGKTTILLTIAGLVRPTEGRITLDEEVLFDAAEKVFVPPHRRRLSLVFQSLALFPHLAVWENVAYGVPKGSSRPRREVALEWLDRARVAHLADRRPSTLSGGESQRVALARALAAEPRMLLLDEPFSALDATLRLELGEALLSLVSSAHVPALLVTHDAQDAARLASRTLRLEAGRVVDDGQGAVR
jgi:molybdate transport system ATP-binding protein